MTERGAEPIIQHWAINKPANRRLPAFLDSFIDGDQHAVRYLARFADRFNGRYELAGLVPRLVYVAVRTPSLPDRLLTLAGTAG